MGWRMDPISVDDSMTLLWLRIASDGATKFVLEVFRAEVTGSCHAPFWLAPHTVIAAGMPV